MYGLTRFHSHEPAVDSHGKPNSFTLSKKMLEMRMAPAVLTATCSQDGDSSGGEGYHARRH